MQVHDRQGRTFRLGEVLGRGGEGEVFTVAGDETLVAKILNPARRAKGKHDKIQAMLERPPTGAYGEVDGLAVLSWPRELLYSSPDKQTLDTFVGYTMTRIQSGDFVPLYQVTTAHRRDALGGEPITWDRLVLLGARLCHVVRTLHRFGYAVGDLNDRNVLVSRRFTPLLMDTDSFQVPRRRGHFPSTVGDQLYWPPELLGVDLTTHRGSRVGGDCYALATVLFQMFMDGNRPYQARGSAVDGLDTLMAKTQAGHFPWAKPKAGVLEPPARAPALQRLPASIQRGFAKCFVDGHKDPKRRPTADWWHKELVDLSRRGFQTCIVEARHVYASDASTCPWCADANDPFAPAAKRIARRARVKAPTFRAKTRAPSAAGARKPPSGNRRTVAQRSGKQTAPSKSTGSGAAKATGAKTAGAKAGAAKAGAAKAGAASPATSRNRSKDSTGAPARPVPKRVAARRLRRKPAPRRGTSAKSSARGRAKKHVQAPREGTQARLVQAAWLAAIVLAFVAPLVWLLRLPGGFEKHAIAAAVTVAAAAAPGIWWARQWNGDVRIGTAWACAWTLAVAGAAAAVAAAGGWVWLELAAGAIALGLAATVFVLLERRQGNLLPPRPRSLLHAAAGLPIAYLPSLVWWAWIVVG